MEEMWLPEGSIVAIHARYSSILQKISKTNGNHSVDGIFVNLSKNKPHIQNVPVYLFVPKSDTKYQKFSF